MGYSYKNRGRHTNGIEYRWQMKAGLFNLSLRSQEAQGKLSFCLYATFGNNLDDEELAPLECGYPFKADEEFLVAVFDDQGKLMKRSPGIGEGACEPDEYTTEYDFQLPKGLRLDV